MTNTTKLESRLKDFRDYVYRKSLQMGEDLMPCDVVDIIEKANRGGRFNDILHRKPYLWRLELLIEVYESCGFHFPDEHREINRDNAFEYF